MSFKIGEQVVCIKKGRWEFMSESHIGVSDPTYNEIYTISGFLNFKNELYFHIKELSPFGAWFSENFRKLDYQFVEEVLEMVKEDQLLEV